MNLLSQFKVQTVIKFLYILIIAGSLVYATAWAADPVTPARPRAATPPTAPTPPATPSNSSGSPGSSFFQGRTKEQIIDERCEKESQGDYEKYTKCVKEHPLSRSNEDDVKDRIERGCKEKYENINKGIQAIHNVCENFLNAKATDSQKTSAKRACKERLEKCGGANPRDNISALEGFAGVLGMPAQQDRNESCFESPQNYFKRRKEFDDKIESLNEKVKTGNKDINAAEKRMNDEIKKLHEQLEEQQERFEKFTEDADKEAAEQEKEALEADIKAHRTIDSLQAKKLELQRNLQNAAASITTQLVTKSRAVGQYKCINEIQKELKDVPPARAGGIQSLTSSSNTLQNQINERFRTCVAEYDAMRADLATKLKDATDDTRNAIVRIDKEIADNQRALQLAETQRAARLAKMDEKKQKEIAKAIQKTQKIAAEVQTARQQATKEMAAERESTSRLQQELNVKQAQRQSLGIEPNESSTDDKSIQAWIRIYNENHGAAQDFENSICCSETAGSGWKNRCDLAKRYSEAGQQKVGGK